MAYDPEELYEETDRDTIEKWLSAVEENISVGAARGGASFSDREKEFIESIREQFDSRKSARKPLSGKQLAWLATLYDRS
jgi:hypothetical protein